MEEKDRLETFFREQFDRLSDEPSPSGWDQPSERVWDGIERHMPIYRRRRRWWVLLLLLVVLGATTFLWLWYAGKGDHAPDGQSEKPVFAETKRTAPQGSAGAQTPSPSDSPRRAAPSVVDTPEENPGPTPQPTPPFAQKPSRGKASESGDASGAARERAATTSEASDPLLLPAPKVPLEKGHPTASHDSPHRAVPALPFLAQPPLGLLATEHAALMLLPGSLPAQEASEGQSWFVEVGAAPVATTRWLRYRTSDVATRFERSEQATLSWMAHALVGVQLDGHWSVSGGVEWFGYTQHSTHLLAMRYTRQNGQTDSEGRLLNTYHTDLPTSFGDASVELRLASESKPAPDLDEGRLFPVQFSATLQMQQWALPLMVQYRSDGDGLRWVARAGLLANGILEKSLRIEAVRVMHPRIEARSVRLVNDGFQRRLADFSLDAAAGVGVQWEVGPGLSLQVLPSVRTNLTRLTDSPRLRTHLFAWSLQLGAVWHPRQ